jgi:hypothetical protein
VIYIPDINFNLVLMLFALSTYATSVRPGKNEFTDLVIF